MSKNISPPRKLGEPFDTQLTFLQLEVIKAKEANRSVRVLMLLAITESVKAARDHSNNCPKDK